MLATPVLCLSRPKSSDLTIICCYSLGIPSAKLCLWPGVCLLPLNRHCHLAFAPACDISDTILGRVELFHVTKDLYAIGGSKGNAWAPEQLKRFAVAESELLGSDVRIVRPNALF